MEFGFGAYFDLFRLFLLFLCIMVVGLAFCHWFNMGFLLQAMGLHLGLAGVRWIQDSRGCLFTFPRRQFPRDWLVWQSIWGLGAGALRVYVVGWCCVFSSPALSCQPTELT